MNYRSLLQSAVFIVVGLALLSALSIAVQWWIPRLAFAICVGGVCLIAELIASYCPKWAWLLEISGQKVYRVH